MDIADILKSTKKLYSACESYSDIGTVSQSDNKNDNIEFKTFFVRPKKFRFEWITYHPYFGKKGGAQRYLVLSDGERVFSSYHYRDNQFEPKETLDLAIAGATGISSGSVRTISDLLFRPDAPECGVGLLHLENVQLLESSWQFWDKHFLRLKGTTCNSRDTDVWLNRNDFSVEKIRKRNVITVEELDRNVADLAERNPELYARTVNVHKRNRRERRYVTEYRYTFKRFNNRIDDKIFAPESIQL